jgi:hypothetical protein
MSRLRFSLLPATIAFAMASTATPARADEALAAVVDDVPVSIYQPGIEGSPYHAGEPTPPGHHVETRMRKDIVLTGALVFGIPYALSAAAGLADPESKRMLIPVVGPALQLSVPRKNEHSLASAATAPMEVFALAMLSVLQCAGAITLIVGLAVEEKVIVRDRAVAVRASPMRLGESGNGVGLTGSF